MRTLSPRRRSTARMLSLAAAAGLGMYHNTDPANPGNGGGGAPPAPATPPAKDPKKIELTDDELQAKIDAAVKSQQDKADAAAKKKQDEADRKAAEEQGKWKELSETEQKRNAELAAENRTLKTRIALGDHLAAKHPEYVARAKYILPLIPGDVADDGLAKAVEDAAAEFVKDNPIQAKGAAGAPAAAREGNRQQGGQGKANGNSHANRFTSSTAADSF
jgi:hypothetical protein